PKGNPHSRGIGKRTSFTAKTTKGTKGKQKSRFGKAVSKRARKR
ncbi:hypothetical protein LCGC14_3042490, partial [marine sediment metagenome]